MSINTDFLAKCVSALETAYDQLDTRDLDAVMYDVFRAACVKQFELALEQSGKLLKKRLRPYFASNREADRLNFKDCFRHAANHGLISSEACRRWLEYRDSRNRTSHDYGENFAEATLRLIPTFIIDITELASVIADSDDE